MAVQDALAATSTRLLPLRPRTTRDGNAKRVRFNNDDSNGDAVVVHVLEIPRARASTSESSDTSEAESESESESDTDVDADADESDERLRLNFNTISISRMPVHTDSQSSPGKTLKTSSLRDSTTDASRKAENGSDSGQNARKIDDSASRVLSSNGQRSARTMANGSLTIGKPKAPDMELNAARVRPKSAYPGVHLVNHNDNSAKRMVRPNFSRPLRRNYSASSAVRLSKNTPTWRGDRFWFDDSEPEGKRDTDSVQHRLRRLRNSSDMQMLMMPSLTRSQSDRLSDASKEAKFRAGDWMVANGLKSSREPLDVKPMFN